MNDPSHRVNVIDVEVADRQSRPVDATALSSALAEVLEAEGVTAASVSLAIVDDREMRELNRRYLEHDWATDVLSFVLGNDNGELEAEIIVSADTAAAAADRFGWEMADELLLYVVHGALHLVGFDDATPAARKEMRGRERMHLARHHLQPRYDDTDDAEVADELPAPGGGQ